MTDVKAICKELLDYEVNEEKTNKTNKPIIIVGPDCTDKNKLRVYVNGGLLGKVYAGTHPKGKTELMNEDYDDYFPKTGALRKLIKGANEKGIQNDTLTSPKYLQMGIQAIEERFKKTREAKEEGDNENERRVESRIVKKYMNTTADWAVVDMEVEFSSKMFPNAKFSPETTKAPRFDLVVIDECGIGIVELKVNNENCTNMTSHYEHMEYVLTHPKIFHDEFVRRIELLKEFELISEKTASSFDDLLQQGDIPIWCGFLFIGGGLEGAQKIAKVLEKKDRIQDIQFMYHDNDALEDLDIHKMLPYEMFSKLRRCN